MKTKTTNFIQRLCLFLFALVLTMPTWAQGGSGNESETITIASKEDWKAFCALVNKGQTTLNAKLTQDVDLGSDIVMAGTEHPYYYNVLYYYTGTFDGQGHTLKFNWNAGEKNYIAPFNLVKDATIKNLRTQGKITTTGGQLSGMVRAAFGTTTISGCISDVDITGGNSSSRNDSRAAGMVQSVGYQASVQITDCLVKGSITDNEIEKERGMAGFVFYNGGTYTLTRCLYVGTNNAANSEYSKTFGTESGISATFTDCYYLNPCGKAQGDKITEAQLRNGYVAYKLQKGIESQVWGQTLGTDNEPQLTADATKRLYEVKFTYNGKEAATRYANSGKGIHGELPTAEELLGTGYNPKMTYALNFGNFTANTPVTEDKSVDVTVTGTFNIASKEDWKAFCNLVNSGQTTLNAKLTQDVDLGEEIVQVGKEDPYYEADKYYYYSGTFDGQGHTLSFNWNAGEKKFIAPFKFVKDATIKNLRTQGKITKKGYGLSGMVYGAHGTTTITGCISDVDITAGGSGWNDSKAAGMVQAVASGASVQITDCLVKGRITDTADEDYRMMAGFVFDNSGTYTLTRCLYVGKNNAANSEYSKTFGTDGYGATFTDCYYLNTCGKAQGDKITAEQLKSGEMAYLLQNKRPENVWGQTLGTDLEPLPTTDATKRVYQVKFTYNGEVKATRYATNGQSIHGGLPTAQDLLGTGYNPHHYYAIAFEGGFNASTPVTADRQVTVRITEKDCYEIASKEDWKAFCALVVDGQNAIDAKMTKDVDLGEDITMLRTPANKYAGTFDGQGHTLTLNWDGGTEDWKSPFYTVENATIKNLRVKGQIKSEGKGHTGLMQNAYGTVAVSGCVSDVDITCGYSTGACSAAGMIQYIDGKATVTFTDCLVKGSINAKEAGRKGMGGFVFEQNGKCTFNNCLYLGTNNAIAGSNTFTYNATINNCYYLNVCNVAQGDKVTEEQLKSGEVTKKLQADRTDKCYWAQQLGKMPDFYNAADKSKANYVYYDAAKKDWACDDFRLTDEQPLPIGLDFTAATVTYERNFNGTKKATLCLPYDLSAQGFKAYTLSGGKKNEVHFKETKDKLTAYTPYYITANGMPQLGGTNIEVKAYTGANLTTPAADYKFTGTVAGVSNENAAAANAYILQDDGKFHKVTTANSAATIPAYRAYIICPPQASGAKQLSVVLDGETTGIGDVTNEATDGKNGPVYDLQGRRVADRLDDARHQLPAGVYIVGGRKVVVK